MIEIPKEARWKIAAILAVTLAFAVFLYHLPQEKTHREGFRTTSNATAEKYEIKGREAVVDYVVSGLIPKDFMNTAWGANATHPSTFLWKEAPIVKLIAIGQDELKSKFEDDFKEIYAGLKLRETTGSFNYLVLIENGSHAKIRQDGKSSILNQLPFSAAKKRTLIDGINGSKNTESSGCSGLYDANSSGYATLSVVIIDPKELSVDPEICIYNQVVNSSGFIKKVYFDAGPGERRMDKLAVSVLYSFSGSGDPIQVISPMTVKERTREFLRR